MAAVVGTDVQVFEEGAVRLEARHAVLASERRESNIRPESAVPKNKNMGSVIGHCIPPGTKNFRLTPT